MNQQALKHTPEIGELLELPDENIMVGAELLTSQQIPATVAIVDLSLQNLSVLNFSQIFDNVLILNLSHNRFDDSTLQQIAVHFPSLEVLQMRSNFIKNSESFEALRDLPLIDIQIQDNPVTLKQTYFDEIMKVLPQLYMLDGLDRDGLRVYFKEEGKRPHRQSKSKGYYKRQVIR